MPPKPGVLAHFENQELFTNEINQIIMQDVRELQTSHKFYNPDAQILTISENSVPIIRPSKAKVWYDHNKLSERLAGWSDGRLHNFVKGEEEMQDNLHQKGFNPEKHLSGMTFIIADGNRIPISITNILLQDSQSLSEEIYFVKQRDGTVLVQNSQQALGIEDKTSAIVQGWTYIRPSQRQKETKSFANIKDNILLTGTVFRALDRILKAKGIKTVSIIQQKGLMESKISDAQLPDFSSFKPGDVIDPHDSRWTRSIGKGRKTKSINIFDEYFTKQDPESNSIHAIANRSNMIEIQNVAYPIGGLGPVYVGGNPSDYMQFKPH